MTSTLEALPTADAAGEIPVRIRRRLDGLNRRRVALGVLLVATAITYLWNITVNGMGNQFYAGAAQAGSKNWKALLFGSVDPDNFITVDKPPVSQWVMGLSGQIFGFSSASMLDPGSADGRRIGGAALRRGSSCRGANAGLLAGALFALTPVVALMFRYNNPDAVMVLLMTAAAYCAVRALERASAKWIALAGVGTRFRVPGQDARGADGDAGDRARLPDRRADDGAAHDCCTCGRARRIPGRRRAGSWC